MSVSRSHKKFFASFVAVVISSAAVWACGSSSNGTTSSNGNDSGTGDEASTAGDGGGVPACTATAPANADLYVSPNGQDAADGTMAKPTTLKAVQGKIQALQTNRTTPIVVYLMDGTYDLKKDPGGPWQITISGTLQAPIVFAAAPGATPTISGGTAITGWTKTTVNSVDVWQASAAGLVPFEQLWVNGDRHYRPTSTANGYLYNDNASQGDGGVTTFTSFSYSGTDVAPSYYDQAHVEVAGFKHWTMSRMHIASIDTTSHVVTINGSTNINHDHGYLPSARYLLDNVQEKLSQPGQWYLDIPKNVVDYVPTNAGEDPNSESIVAPQQPALLVASNASYVTLQGITFSYSNWTVPASGWTDCQTESDPSADLPAAISLQNTSFFSVDSCVFSHMSAIGVEMFGNASGTSFPNASADCKTTFDNRIVNSAVYDTGGGGIRVGHYPSSPQDPAQDTDQNVAQCDLVENNAVTGTGRFFPSGNGIVTGNAHHLTVRHNEVSDTYTYAIDVGMTYGNRPDNYVNQGLAHDNTIELNLVHDVGQGVTSDIGGIYTAMGPQTGNVVQNNVVHDVTHDPGNPAANIPEGYGGWGLYNDASSSNVTWQNNLAYRCSQTPFHFNYGQNGLVQNNIFAYGTEGAVERSNSEGHLSFTFKDNIVYWDTPGIWQRGDWTCAIGDISKCVAASDNLYVDVGGTAGFIKDNDGTKLGQPPHGQILTFADWQALGEDPSPSTVGGGFTFGTAASPTFTLPATLPTGFKVFDPTQAGRTCTTLPIPKVPAAFPVQAWPAQF